MYKKIIFALLFSGASLANAQVIIGNATGGAATDKQSILLEFATGQNKGIIVPYVRTLPVAPTEGTIVLDVVSQTNARVKFYNGNTRTGTNGYEDLSGQPGNLTGPPNLMTLQPTVTEDAAAAAIIGTVPSPIPANFPQGVLVLNSDTKAMILPTVADVQNVLKPSPGMMVYVNKQGFKRLAVFNGSKWSFFSPVSTVTTATGRIWMDRNLGAARVATSSIDGAAFGDKYQWGRLKDGHQITTSTTTATLSSGDVPPNGNFIVTSAAPNNWRSSLNNTLWQGVNGTNNPCPSGFRIPTIAEFAAEAAFFTSQNSAGAFASPLKLPLAGFRDYSGLLSAGNFAYYWASDVSITNVRQLYFTATQLSTTGTAVRAFGQSVRCIKN